MVKFGLKFSHTGGKQSFIFALPNTYLSLVPDCIRVGRFSLIFNLSIYLSIYLTTAMESELLFVAGA